MGKLHDLVKLRNTLLSKIDEINLAQDIQHKVYILDSIVEQGNGSGCIDLVENIQSNFDALMAENQKLLNDINSVVYAINQSIDNHTLEWFSNVEYKAKFSEESLNQTLSYTSEITEQVTAKITQYCSWHYPALQISPRSKKWIDTMISSDPLYLTHTNIDYCQDIIKEYPELYQNRLRLYKITDRNFSSLPQGQFGFVLSWDNFNYLSLDKIEQYIREVFLLLRPGGSFMFSYNNCEFNEPAFRIECHAGSFASSRHLIKLFNEVGYEIIDLCNVETDDAFNTHVSWAEVKKPGKLKTIKTAPAMAKILIK